jgi:hypothetical protein
MQQTYCSGKIAKIGKKVFCGIRFLGEGLGNFAKIQSDFCKIVFLMRNPIFAKKICKHFHNVVRYIPMG